MLTTEHCTFMASFMRAPGVSWSGAGYCCGCWGTQGAAAERGEGLHAASVGTQDSRIRYTPLCCSLAEQRVLASHSKHAAGRQSCKSQKNTPIIVLHFS